MLKFHKVKCFNQNMKAILNDAWGNVIKETLEFLLFCNINALGLKCFASVFWSEFNWKVSEILFI